MNFWVSYDFKKSLMQQEHILIEKLEKKVAEKN